MDKKKLHINEASGKNYPEPDVPVEDAWNNMKELLQLAPAVPAVPSKFRFSMDKMAGKFLGAAGAVVIAAITVYVVAIKQENPQPSQKVYKSGAVPKSDTLVDGTIAFLDIYTNIAVSAPANKERRIILNNGGCYLRGINNEPAKTWQVQVGPVIVLPNKANIFISVDSASGTAIIQVQNGHALLQAGEQKLQLAGGESVRFNTQKEIVLNKQKGNPNLYSYANKVFEFSSTPLKDVIQLIEKAYGVQFVVQNNILDNCVITTRFDNMPLENILDVLTHVFPFEYRIDKTKNQVIITGNGCD